MGITTCYCALCSGPATECSVGSTAPGALEWRRKRVARKRKLFMETGRYPSRYGTDDDWDEEELRDEYDVNEGGWTKHDENYAYDPELVSEETLLKETGAVLLTYLYLDVLPCFRGFISGPGWALDHMVEIQVEIGDGIYLGGDNPVFPFHFECFCVLAWALDHETDSNNLDRTVLYEVMKEFSQVYHHLELDYGQIQGPEQDWYSVPGEEYVVTDPLIDETDFLRELVTRNTFKHAPRDNDIQKHVVDDPFDKIPFDILYNILSWLPGSSICALSKASWAVTRATRYNAFWKQLLAQEMEWLWEINDILNEDAGEASDAEADNDDNDDSGGEGRFVIPADLGLKRLYLYLDEKTTPSYAMDAEFMGLGNRRRIWRPCQQLAEVYFKKLKQKSADAVEGARE
ncbi:hypothetical protein GX51_03867 [Blastomyces parvus]|uniref:F-box domain-containing protein n=1 Tax=Blastomyces parvus TaxID=2060905 RepID=A0A2B7X4L4_9EURO|nr:hypothetical protein GX51_03867 [Blastomyces parvus]